MPKRFPPLLLTLTLTGLMMSAGECVAVSKASKFGARIKRFTRSLVRKQKPGHKKDRSESPQDAVSEFNRKVSSIPPETIVYTPRFDRQIVQEGIGSPEEFATQRIDSWCEELEADQIKIDERTRNKLHRALEEVWNHAVKRSLLPPEVGLLVDQRKKIAYRLVMFRDGLLEFTRIHPSLAESAEEFQKKAVRALEQSLRGHRPLGDSLAEINEGAAHRGKVEGMTNSVVEKLRSGLPQDDFISMWTEWRTGEINDGEITRRLEQILSDAQRRAQTLIQRRDQTPGASSSR